MEIIELRHFSSGDLRPLLDAECEVWQSRLDWDYSSSAEMVLRYVDSKILPGFAALERGRVLGYAFYVLEGSKGVVGDVFVDRTRGDVLADAAVQDRLLRQMIRAVQESPGVFRAEAQLLLQDSGDAAHPFLANGFARHKRLFMERTLEDRGDVGIAAGGAFEIRKWGESDFQSVAELISSSYEGHVDAEINDQYQSTSGSLRFLNNIIRFPGCGTFDAGASFLAVDAASRQLAGVVLCSTIRADVGHITQICVHPGFRGRGLGAQLLESTAATLYQRGFRYLSLTVTEVNQGAVGLYRKLGFAQRHEFDAFVWTATPRLVR